MCILLISEAYEGQILAEAIARMVGEVDIIVVHPMRAHTLFPINAEPQVEPLPWNGEMQLKIGRLQPVRSKYKKGKVTVPAKQPFYNRFFRQYKNNSK